MEFPFLSNRPGPEGTFPINLYLVGDSESGEPCLRRTPGLILRRQLTGNQLETRGAIVWRGALYAVIGPSLYRIDPNWNATNLGMLATDTGPIMMAAGDTKLAIADGAAGRVFDRLTGTMSGMSSFSFVTIAYMDGYWLASEGITDSWYLSANGDPTTWSPLDEGLAGMRADSIRQLVTNEGQLLALGEDTLEWYWNSGEADFPMTRVSGAGQEIGAAGKWTAATVDKSVFWLDNYGRVVRSTGNSYQVVSTPDLERRISGYDWPAAIGSSIYWQGAAWYVLTFPTDDKTFVHDASTQSWFQLSSGLEGGRHRCPYFMRMGTKVAGIDRDNGKVYQLDKATYTEDGEAIRLERVTSPAFSESKHIRHDRLELRMKTGVGTDPTNEPVSILQFSDDHMETWSEEMAARIGKIGTRETRAFWDGLGIHQHLIYRWICTEAIPIEIFGASLDVTPGIS